MVGYCIWIDDQYDDPATPARHPPSGFLAVHNSAEAIDLIKRLGIPDFISFDHDFGIVNGEEDNAMNFINWMIDVYYDSEVPEYQVHSANPVGKLNIIAKMESWRKSKSL